jgi:lysophospholipase L1-like esterase/fibronectin type 3 domain-containing protein
MTRSPSPHAAFPRRSMMMGLGAASLAVAAGAVPAAADDGAGAAGSEVPSHSRKGGRRTMRFDFGPGRTAGGHRKVRAATGYTRHRGYGFEDTSTVEETSRGGHDRLRSDFVTAHDARFLVDLPPGDYHVTVLAGDPEGPTDISLTSQEIQKIEPTSTATGEFLETSYDIALVDRRMVLALSGEAAHLNALTITPLAHRRPGKNPTVFTLGDSTMQTYEPYWMPQTGWGQVLGRFLTGGPAVDNRSIGGRSSRSFLQEGRLDEVLLEVRPGDDVFVQFGHNDATKDKPERYTSPEDFRTYLTTYVDGIRQRGAHPILVTAVSRLDVDEETGRFAVSFPEYVEATKDVARSTGAALVDLSAASRHFLDGIGADAATGVFLHADPGIYPDRPAGVADDTHFQQYGAIQMARLVARATADLDLGLSGNIDLHESADVPAGPGGVELVRASASSLELSWPAQAGVDTYHVYLERADGGPDHTADAGPRFVRASMDPTITVYGLEADTEYVVTLAGKNEHGEGDRGEPVTLATLVADARYDLGPADSPSADGWTRVPPDDAYSEKAGFGLVDAADVTAQDRGTDAGDDVARDFIASASPYTFRVDLPDGPHRVVLTIGDADGSARTEYALQGEQRGEVKVDDGARQVVEDVTVDDGTLRIGISGASGHLNGVATTAL